jgi:hypothetical protein
VDRAALKEGRSFEEQFAKRMGAELVPNSGAGWFAKLDVGARKFIWSLKWTGKRTFTMTPELMKEAQHAVVGPGGLGADYTGGVVTSIGGEEYVTIRVDDFVDLVRDEVKLVPTSKVDERRARARGPLLPR